MIHHQLLDILKKMFIQGDFKKVIRPFKFNSNPETDKELKKDFEQELIIILANYKQPEKIIQMYWRDKNELMRFLITIIKNNVCSESSPYWKKYGKWEYNRKKFQYENHEQTTCDENT